MSGILFAVFINLAYFEPSPAPIYCKDQTSCEKARSALLQSANKDRKYVIPHLTYCTPMEGVVLQ